MAMRIKAGHSTQMISINNPPRAVSIIISKPTMIKINLIIAPTMRIKVLTKKVESHSLGCKPET